MRLVPRDPAWPPPRLLARWQTWVVLMAVLVVPFFVPIPVGLRRDVLVSTLGDRLHIVLPAGITLLLYWKGPLRGHLLRAAAGAVLLGGAIELLQELVGRTALWHDFLLDAMGVGMVTGWVAWRAYGRRAGLVLLAALAVTAVVQLRELPARVQAAADAEARFPVLEDFEGRHVWHLWGDTDESRLSMPAAAARTGNRGLRITGSPPSRWPGAGMRRFPHDWSGFATLELDVRHTSAGRDSVRFGVRLDDFPGIRDHDWLDAGFTATREWRTFRVPLAGRTTRWSKRPFDLTDVDALTIFLVAPGDTVSLEVDDIRLR